MPLRHATAGSELLSFCDLVGQAVWVEMSENTWLWIRALPLPLESSLAEAVGARNLKSAQTSSDFFGRAEWESIDLDTFSFSVCLAIGQ